MAGCSLQALTPGQVD